jgi:hypothetical protein
MRTTKKIRGLETLGEAPLEASYNLQVPELAPSDGRITGRTKSLSLKSTPEFHQELKMLAVEERCLMIEVLEKALESYKKLKKSKLTSFSNLDFTCDRRGGKFENETAYFFATNSNLLRASSTYCESCI